MRNDESAGGTRSAVFAELPREFAETLCLIFQRGEPSAGLGDYGRVRAREETGVRQAPLGAVALLGEAPELFVDAPAKCFQIDGVPQDGLRLEGWVHDGDPAGGIGLQLRRGRVAAW